MTDSLLRRCKLSVASPGNCWKGPHKHRLHRSSDEEYGGIPLKTGLEYPAASTAFAIVPVVLFSVETLTYLGLSEAKANKIWYQWTHWPPTGPRREIDARLSRRTHDLPVKRENGSGMRATAA